MSEMAIWPWKIWYFGNGHGQIGHDHNDHATTNQAKWSKIVVVLPPPLLHFIDIIAGGTWRQVDYIYEGD